MTETVAKASAVPSPGPLPSPLPGVGRLLVAQVRYQLRVLLRTPRAIGAGVVLPVILLVISSARHASLPASHLAGLAALGLTITAWTTHGISLVAAREAGILKRWRATPLPAWCYFAGRIAATLLIAVLAGMVTVLAGAVFYGTHLAATAAISVLAACVLGALAWAAAATAVTGIVPTVESAWPILGLTYLPVILISGAFGPLPGEPGWLAALASYLPAEPMIDAVTRSLQHAPSAPFLPARDVIVLIAWAAAGLIGSLALFRWEPHRTAQRRAG